MNEVSFSFCWQDRVQIQVVVNETLLIDLIVANVLLDLLSEVGENCVGFLLTSSNTGVVSSPVVINEIFEADVYSSLSEVVEGTLYDG